MKPQFNLAITGTGNGAPERRFTNADFEEILDTSDEWIQSRTGIRERRFTSEGESCLTMSVDASRKAIDDAGITADDVDMIILGTISPHYPLPATACLLQTELGCRQIPAFDISAACSGFMYGMILAGHVMTSGPEYRNVLVIGSENMSSILDFEDRASCVLFGDAASAAVLSRTDDPDRGVIYSKIGADGAGARMIWIPAGGSNEPTDQRVVDERLQYMRMQGREVYKFAVKKMHELIDDVFSNNDITADDLAMVIPHQSNLRIIASVREKLDLPEDKVLVNIDRYGNTSSASVGICLDEARRDGRVKEGDLVLMLAMGAGLTWAATLLRL
jgi:3-oxoacyl-[acyl-carrier-protein] synthase-3